MKKKITIIFGLLACSYSHAQNVGVDVASPVEKLDVAGAIRVGNTTNANAGTLRWTGTAFEGYNGSAWLNLGSLGGITSLNTLTGAVQTFAIGTAGTAPAFSPAGTVHTLNIPFASTSGVTGGILSNTQYTTLLNGILPSGLTGQTLRHNGTTWVANSVIYNDGTNVGIGQTPGAAYLDVAGTNGGTTSLQLRSGNVGTGGTSSQITFGYNGTENYRQAIKTRHQSSGTSNAIDFYVWDQPNDVATTIGTLNVMSITGLNNGSVGIGVNAPGAQLHTTGSVRFAGLSAASQTSAVMTDGSGNLSTRALNPVAFSGTLANHTAGTGLSGSVYDGSAAQTWSVVYGTTAGTAVQGNQAATITAGNGLTGGISADALGDGFTSTLDVAGATSGAIQVNTNDIAVRVDNSTITINGSNQLQVSDVPASDADYIQNLTVGNNFAAGQNASLDVTGNAEIGGTLEVNGSVGIGTTGPTDKLEAIGGNGSYIKSTATQSGSNNWNGFQIKSWVSSATDVWNLQGGSLLGGGSMFSINNNAAVRLLIDNNGNVGMGSSSPADKLEVVGGNGSYIRSISTQSGSNNWSGFQLKSWVSSATDLWSLQGGSLLGGGTKFSINNNGTSRLWIDETGKVGVGTTNPGDGLTIAKDGATLGIQIKTDASGFNEIVYRNASGGAIADILSSVSATGYGTENGGLAFFTGSSFSAPRMVIKSDGNVGIGTIGPAYDLDIRQKGNSQGTNGVAVFATTGTRSVFFQGGDDKAYLFNFNNGIEFYAGNAQRMSILGTGNVGIGTGGPTALLSVNGAANNTTGAWGVFSDERVKTLTGDFTDGLSVIKQIHPVRFKYNENAPFKADGEQIGIIAQDLEKIAPYMVSQKNHNEFKDLREVNNQAYIFLLINATKEQQVQIEAQQKQIDSQQQQINDLVKQLGGKK